MKPVYFDLSVNDLPSARTFLERVFGWQFEQFPMPFAYYRITAGPADEVGIDGGIGAIANATDPPMTVLTLPVSDLKPMIAKVEANGGKILGPILDIPGVGQHVTCLALGGLSFGLLQTFDTAKPPES